jgi:peptidoglycan/LPS O-acetylase OafA/YrhL
VYTYSMSGHTSRSSARLKHVDGLRAVAVLSVVLYHFDIPGLNGGFIGVDVFFVISGFLVSKYVLQDLQEGSFSFRRFYIRRFYRLLPAHLTMLVGTAICSFLMASADIAIENARSSLFSLVAASNFYFWQNSDYFAAGAVNRPLLHTWSLSVEEQFYFMWPHLLVVMYKVRHRFGSLRFQFFVLVGTSCAASFTFLPAETMARFFIMPFRAYEFALGALCLYLDVWCNKMYVADCCSITGAVLLAWSLINVHAEGFPNISIFACLAGSALLLSTPASKLNQTIMSCRMLAYIGDTSYSLYLVHWPVRVFAGLAFLGGEQSGRLPISLKIFMLMTSFACAHILHAFVEDPMRSYKVEQTQIYLENSKAEKSAIDRLPLQQFRFHYMLLCVIVTLSAAFSSLRTAGWAFRPSIGNDVKNLKNSYIMNQQVNSRGMPLRPGQGYCGVDYGTYRIGTGQCTGNVTYLLGDSHARHLAPAFGSIARSRNMTVLCSDVFGCPPLNYDDIADLPAAKSKGCAQMRSYVKKLLRARPSLVVLSAHWELHLGKLSHRDVNWGETMEGTRGSHQSAIVASALLKFVRALVGVGHRVVILGATPRLPLNSYTCLKRRGWIGARCPLSFHQPVRLALVNNILKKVTEQCQGCEYVDLVPAFCETFVADMDPDVVTVANSAYISHCYSVLNQTLLFRDLDHLTYEGALSLVKIIDQIYK